MKNQFPHSTVKWTAVVLLFCFLSSCSSKYWNIGDNEQAKQELLSMDEESLIKLASGSRTRESTLFFLASNKDNPLLDRAIAANPNVTLPTLSVINKRKHSDYQWERGLNETRVVRSACLYAADRKATGDSLLLLAGYSIGGIDKAIISNPSASLDALAVIYANHLEPGSRHPWEKKYREHPQIINACSYAKTGNNRDDLIRLSQLGIEIIDWYLAANPNAPAEALSQIHNDIFVNRSYTVWYDINELLSLYALIFQNRNMPAATLEKAGPDWCQDDIFMKRVVRELIATHPNTPQERLIELAGDEDLTVSAAVAANPAVTADLLDMLVRKHDNRDNHWLWEFAAKSPISRESTLEYIAENGDADVQYTLTKNKILSPALLNSLTANEEVQILIKAGNNELPTVFDMLADNSIRLSVYPKEIREFELNITLLKRRVPDFVIPAGTFFPSANKEMQDMISTKNVLVQASGGINGLISIPVACANHEKTVPRYGNRYSMYKASENENLNKLIRTSSASGNYSYGIMQAAVWIITDNLDSDKITQLNDNGRRLIRYNDVGMAMKLIDEAGIDITQFKVWTEAPYLYGKCFFNKNETTSPNVFLRKWFREKGIIYIPRR